MFTYLERSSLSELLPFFFAASAGDDYFDSNQFWSSLVREQNLALDTPSVSVTHVARAKGIKSARMLQKKAARMLLTLQTLTESLKDINASFKERVDCMALRHGLDSLPDEILLQILGDVTSIFTEALELSHVCSRFRQVMLASPRIWANCRLNTDMDPRQYWALVDRSQNCPLKVDIDRLDHDWDWRVAHLFSFSLKDRLEDVDFQFLPEDQCDQISRDYPKTRMAGLRNLTITHGSWLHFLPRFYVSWSLPNLKCLRVTGFIPEPVFGQNLSYCHMKLSNQFEPETLKLFLQSLTSLETLNIELIGTFMEYEDIDEEEEGDDDEDSGDYDDDNGQEDLSSRISSIASFSFSVIDKTPVSFARRVLETIRLNVTDMSFTIVYPSYRNLHLESRRDQLLKSLRHFPLVEKLHLLLAGYKNNYILDFGKIRLRVPCLANLNIEAPGHELFMTKGWVHTLPRLRSLQFRNCDRLGLQTLEDVHDDFLLNDMVIGKVEVVCCHLVEEKILRDTFPNTEVVWIP